MESELKRLRKLEEEVYNKTVKNAYDNDTDRLDYEREVRAASRAEATGYYASQAISGYIIGTVIGAVLGIFFVWNLIIVPWVLPIIKYIFGGK